MKDSSKADTIQNQQHQIDKQQDRQKNSTY